MLNEYIELNTKAGDLFENSTLRWFGHESTMNEDQIAKQKYEGKINRLNWIELVISSEREMWDVKREILKNKRQFMN